MRRIVTDEQRRPAPNSARRFAVDLRAPLDGVNPLARGNQHALRGFPCHRGSEIDPGHCRY